MSSLMCFGLLGDTWPSHGASFSLYYVVDHLIIFIILTVFSFIVNSNEAGVNSSSSPINQGPPFKRHDSENVTEESVVLRLN